MAEKDVLAEKHNLLNEINFRLKSAILIGARSLKDLIISQPRRFRARNQLKHHPVIASSETDLWNTDDNETNWILTAGKVQNLRIAARKLDGLEVPANQVFSFWRHVGWPSKLRGYVPGREIREGCVVPTIAGGLCQLSNALYDAALKAGFEIVERHKHTRVIKGSLAEQGRDATVKWNYIDLRFKTKGAFRIEVDITSENLVVRFRSASTNDVQKNFEQVHVDSSKLNDCYSCGNFDCFKHPKQHREKESAAITTYLLDEKWIEYDRYIKEIATTKDYFIAPLRSDSRMAIARYQWAAAQGRRATYIQNITLLRSLIIRALARTKQNIFAASLKLDRIMARRMVRHIPIESTHLVVSQNLLPFVWQSGALGGRTFDVLMTRLPMETLHQRLDLAHALHCESRTLNDFRAPSRLVEIESLALTKARRIVTPHREIANIFANKCIQLEWTLPNLSPKEQCRDEKILFPASGLGRKGAYEIRQLARELGLSLVVLGDAFEDPSFWDGIEVQKTGANPFTNITVVVSPAYVEHQPRVLLKAIASGIPVIATTACGLTPSENITVVPVGDYDALKTAVSTTFRTRDKACLVPTPCNNP